jgi:hypothetical protein
MPFRNIGYFGGVPTVPRSSGIFPVYSRGSLMKKMDERTAANMEVALEQVCRSLPHGGDHATRKRIARKLLHEARHGSTTLGDFMAVARSALHETSVRKSA